MDASGKVGDRGSQIQNPATLRAGSNPGPSASPGDQTGEGGQVGPSGTESGKSHGPAPDPGPSGPQSCLCSGQLQGLHESLSISCQREYIEGR